MTMDARVVPFGRLLSLNRRLALNCLDGMTNEQAAARIVPALNSASFLMAHLIDARHALLGVLGARAANPVAAALERATSIEDVGELPPLETLRTAWLDIDEALQRRLVELTAEDLEQPSAQRYPGVDRTVLGALAFLVQHDSYHLGQLALLRRALGLPAMRYA